MLAAPMAPIDRSFTGETPTVVAHPRPPFLLVHTPGGAGSWTVEDAGLPAPTWVPDVTDLLIVPGTSGIPDRRRGVSAEEQVAMVRTAAQVNGRTILPRSLGYMVATPCTDPSTGEPGTLHHRAWERIHAPMRVGESATLRVQRGAQNVALLDYHRRGEIPSPPEGWADLAVQRLIDLVHAAAARTNATDETRRHEIGRAAATARRAIRAARPWDSTYTPDPDQLAEIERIWPEPEAEPEVKAKATKRPRGEA